MDSRIALRSRADHLFAYSGRSVLVTDLDGVITDQGTEGFYVEDTRLLSCYELRANGHRLMPIVASPVRGNTFLSYAKVPQEAGVPKEGIYITIGHFVDGGMRTTLRIENYHAQDRGSFTLALHVAADFADINATEAGTREQTADVATEWDEQCQRLLFRYCHPELDRAVAIHVEQPSMSADWKDEMLRFSLDLVPHQAVELQIAVEPIYDGTPWNLPSPQFGSTGTMLDEIRETLRQDIPRLVTTNPTLSRAWQTATNDLATLPLGLDGGPAAPIAGVPIYQRFFGRDMLTISWQAMLAVPGMMKDSLQLMAAWQGSVIDDWRDEEPGKMIHQARWGPLSVLNVDPVLRYYGDYAAPSDFLIMLGQYLAWTNDLTTVRKLLPAARKAIQWLDRYGDLDGDGFLEYVTRSEKGVKNQGWKDSPPAIVDNHGNIVDNPIGTSELQAYWYAGLQLAATAFFAAGDGGYAVELLKQARQLKQRFDAAFWMEAEGFYAMGLGPDKQQIRSIGSNAGHLLASGIVPKEKAKRVAERLMAPDLFSGWGVRTLSSTHSAYNPFSYHLGSVWPVETGTFALGFGRYGCITELHQLAEGFFAMTDLFVDNRLPEAIGGMPRDREHPHPGIYPKSNEPQGWSASAVVLVVQSLLGMRPVAPLGLLLIDPYLPEWLPDLRLEGVRVGESRLDLEFHRTPEGKTRYKVHRREGRIRVLRQPAPQGPHGTPSGRLRAALGSFGRT
jgi:glycogen debranching enzyme